VFCAMRKYFLRTARLGFGRWREGDSELALALWGDARVTKLIGGPFTDAQVRERLAQEIATLATDGVQYWPVFRLYDNAHVGCCGLRPYGRQANLFEIGFHVRVEHWGNGYATEAAREVIRYAFRNLRAQALVAGHGPDNVESRRVL